MAFGPRPPTGPRPLSQAWMAANFTASLAVPLPAGACLGLTCFTVPWMKRLAAMWAVPWTFLLSSETDSLAMVSPLHRSRVMPWLRSPLDEHWREHSSAPPS